MNTVRPPIRPTTQLEHGASGGKLRIVGEVYCTVSKDNSTTYAIVYLTGNPELSLLG